MRLGGMAVLLNALVFAPCIPLHSECILRASSAQYSVHFLALFASDAFVRRDGLPRFNAFRRVLRCIQTRSLGMRVNAHWMRSAT